MNGWKTLTDMWVTQGECGINLDVGQVRIMRSVEGQGDGLSYIGGEEGTFKALSLIVNQKAFSKSSNTALSYSSTLQTSRDYVKASMRSWSKVGWLVLYQHSLG